MKVTHHIRMKRNHMATTFDFVLSLPAHRPAELRLANQALRKAHEEVARLEDELSEYREASPVRRLNAAPPGERVAMPASALELLRRSGRIRAQSEGHFDCTIKGTPGEIAWDDTHAWRTHPGAHLGFGAIGKGYALDGARTVLEAAGFGDFLLSGGGSSVILAGFAAPGDPWTFGWSWKKDERGEDLGILLTHASGRPVALGVSGTHEKGRHIISPRASCSPPEGVGPRASCSPPEGVGPRAASDLPLSSLFAAASAADADAWSTALFTAGFTRGLALLQAAGPDLWPAPAVAQIGADGVPAWNGTFQQLWGAIA